MCKLENDNLIMVWRYRKVYSEVYNGFLRKYSSFLTFLVIQSISYADIDNAGIALTGMTNVPALFHHIVLFLKHTKYTSARYMWYLHWYIRTCVQNYQCSQTISGDRLQLKGVTRRHQSEFARLKSKQYIPVYFIFYNLL